MLSSDASTAACFAWISDHQERSTEPTAEINGQQHVAAPQLRRFAGTQAADEARTQHNRERHGAMTNTARNTALGTAT